MLCGLAAVALLAAPLDGALKLKLGSAPQDCISTLGQNPSLTQDSVSAAEMRYGGIFDSYYNSVVKLHFRNGKLARISIEMIPGNPGYAFDEIERKITARYQVDPAVDTEALRAVWNFDNSRRIELRQANALVILDYVDELIASEAEDTSAIY